MAVFGGPFIEALQTPAVVLSDQASRSSGYRRVAEAEALRCSQLWPCLAQPAYTAYSLEHFQHATLSTRAEQKLLDQPEGAVWPAS
ncbi:hypothetical protein RIEGSTA812A_PEG_521 [invertebrate metagenome]|uniref:Uncharacterized protein n=1 Tax=invertebrate metagenome TaxID=1711999 RepID=A0A484HA95_9ZZZZ